MNRSILFILLCTGLISQSCGQNYQVGDNLTIDSNVQNEVEKYISPFSENKSDSLGLIYNSKLIWDSYEDDTLVNSTKDSLVNAPFKAFYYVKNDSLFIVGEFGLISGFRFGFLSTTQNEMTNIVHFFCDEMPSFKHKKEDSLQYCIDVSCPKSNLVLSSLPNSKTIDPIYGYAEFETEDFYEKGSKGIRKTRSKMKIYFYARVIKIK